MTSILLCFRKIRVINKKKLILFTALFLNSALADDYFDKAAIENEGSHISHIDISALEHPGGQLPGRYSTDVYVNGVYKYGNLIKFRESGSAIHPDIKKSDLIEWGVNENATPAFFKLKNDAIITSFNDLIPGGSITYSFPKQRIDVTIPQLYLKSSTDDGLKPEQWNNGLTALFLNYMYTGSTGRSELTNGNSSDNYIEWKAGINFAAWRLRTSSYWAQNQQSNHYGSLKTSLQRDIPSLRSQLVIGEYDTSSEIFNNFSFRGVQLFSDENMQTESQRGFAPVIHGVANSNARVTVSQNNNIIYQTNVPPGPFVINDLNSSLNSGDIDITILEENGEIRHFTQSFSAVPIMKREGDVKYAITAGQYHPSYGINDRYQQPAFLQSTVIYGLPYEVTLYGGYIFAENYASRNMGFGKGLGDIGAISVDNTWSKTLLDNSSYHGQSLRFQYAKTILNSGTTLSLAGYRYSNSEYLDFNSANEIDRTSNSEAEREKLIPTRENLFLSNLSDYNINYRNRSRKQVNLNQSIDNYGYLYLSYYEQKYWGVAKKGDSLIVGYSKNFNAVSCSLSYSETTLPWDEKKESAMSFNIQIPLEGLLSSSYLSFSSSKSDSGATVNSAGISGTTLQDKNLFYNIQQGLTGRNSDAGSLYADYKTSSGEYQTSYSYTSKSKKINYSLIGGVLFHPYGVTLSQYLGDTVALVRTKGAAGIKVDNNNGLYTDRWGYAVVPYVAPYRTNMLKVRTETAADYFDIEKDTVSVVPNHGAVILADFPTSHGYKILFNLLSDKNIPFGAKAEIYHGDKSSSGIVDDRHRVYFSGVPLKGEVIVAWEGHRCSALYNAKDNEPSVQKITSYCNER